MVKLQSEAGILAVPVGGEIGKDMKGSGYLWSNSLLGYMEQGMIENSGRVTNRLLNSLLHRDDGLDAIKLRTMTDLLEEEGTVYYRDQVSWSDRTLEKAGYNLETLLPPIGTIPNHGILDDSVCAMDKEGNPLSMEERHALIDEAVMRLNEKKPQDERLDIGAEKIYQIEPDANKAVKISMDGVGVKRQKDTRPKGCTTDTAPIFVHDAKEGPEDYTRAPDPKKRPKVETAVGHVEYAGKKYVFAGKNMFDTSKLILAFLISHNLLAGNLLIFFTDGGRDIRYCIEHIFKIYQPIEILDWFHLRKHCCEALSMSLKGGKANRNMQYEVKRRLFRMLWAGNVKNAVSYLQSLDRSCLKPGDKIADLVAYLLKNESRIACYALRRNYGLQVSSNRVEKANDLIVASRQKGDSMSWSREGSWGLANITVKYMNKEAKSYREKGVISFEMNEEYGQVFDLKSKEAVAG